MSSSVRFQLDDPSLKLFEEAWRNQKPLGMVSENPWSFGSGLIVVDEIGYEDDVAHVVFRVQQTPTAAA